MLRNTFSVFMFFFTASCLSESVVETQVVNSTVQIESYTEPASPKSNVMDVMQCERPFAKDSIWNVPIDWSRAHIHPNSDLMMEAFFSNQSWIGSDTGKYAANIYFVNNDTPLVPVTLWSGRRFRDAYTDVDIQYGKPGGTVFVPLPLEARPAPGTDGELAVVNVETGEEWGLVNGEIDGEGHWLVGGLYRYHIQNSGIPPKGFAHRGAGIGSFAGIVRPCEVERGYIGHAVTIAYDSPCAPDICKANNWPAVISPFTKTDGEVLSKFDIPEGARLVIKPEISRRDILDACLGVKGCIVWTQNMQEYGAFIVDNSAHPKTYAEGDATANWSSGIWSDKILRYIPPDWYAVIDWNYPSTTIP
jgi:hypothetical protein